MSSRRLRPRCDEYEYDEIGITYDLVVYEEDGVIDTGLLDEHGEPILRNTKAPMGFLAEIIE